MRLLFIIFIFLAGAGVGYYFGTDQGFERAVRDFGLSDVGQKDEKEDAIRARDVAENVGIVDLWQSTNDSKFTREFLPNGVVVDRYADDPRATSEGIWHTFESPTDEQTPFTIQPGVKYLRVDMTEEVLYFSISKMTENELELVYLGLGGTLRFTRVR